MCYIYSMGIFQEFNDFMGEITSLKNELTDIGDGVIKDVTTSAKQVKKTVNDTATELKDSAKNIQSTLNKSTSLAPVEETVEEQSNQDKQ